MNKLEKASYIAGIFGTLIAIIGLVWSIWVFFLSSTPDPQSSQPIINISGDNNTAISGNNNTIQNFQTKKLTIKNVPKDLFENFSAGTPSEKIINYFGSPQKKQSFEHIESWFYKINNNVMQFDIKNRVVYALSISLNKEVKDFIPIFPLDKTITSIQLSAGQLTLGDLIKQSDCYSPKKITSARSSIVFSQCYFGKAGMYRTYYFGYHNDEIVPEKLIEYVVVQDEVTTTSEQNTILDEAHCDGKSICLDYLL